MSNINNPFLERDISFEFDVRPKKLDFIEISTLSALSDYVKY